MRLSFFVALFIMLPLVVFSQKKKHMFFDDNWQIARTPATTVYECECYVDDSNKFIGAFTCYHKTMNVLVKEYYFNKDVLHGTVKEFYLNNQIKLDAEYDNGSPINEWWEYEENGAVVLERVFPATSVLNDEFVLGTTSHGNAIGFSHKKEEPPIYTTACICLKMEDQRYSCSEAALAQYLGNPPIPKVLKNDPAYMGKKFECSMFYTLSDKGIVSAVEIIKSTGDKFLDLLAEAHVLNMVPFESAKQYGMPIAFKLKAQITFTF